MKATLLYRIASVVFLLFAAGHTLGFLKFKPLSAEGLAVRGGMKNVFFSVGSRQFSYDGFYTGFGLYITAYLIFSALLSWHMGEIANSTPQAIGLLGWEFAALQAATLVLSWIYFFPLTAIFSAVVFGLVAAAAWQVK
jgi:hypothetical protein